LIIFSLKKFKNAVDRVEADKEEGSTVDELRERRDCRVDQSFLGCLEHWKMRDW